MVGPPSFEDFDAAWREHELQPFTVTIPADEGSEFDGDEVTMPATMPAGFRLHMWRVRQERGPDAELSYAESATLAAFLFGVEKVSRWYAQRITETTLMKAMNDIAVEYAVRDRHRAGEDGGPGKAWPPGSEVPPT